ncbi:MAG: 6-phosphofructokinase [Planctomycetota bacterium]
MQLGVFTVGSDAPGLNAVIRAVVRTAAMRYEADVFGFADGFSGLLQPPTFWALSPADVTGLSRRGGTILGCNRDSPFDAGGVDRSAEVLETVRWLGLDGLICIGGEGSLVIAHRLAELGAPLVAIPKTVENDTAGTAVTFGYATAVDLAVSAIDMLQTTSETTHRVQYLEVTGRQAGWIALESALAGGADVALLPEIPHRVEAVAEAVVHRRSAGKRVTVVVVAEGARVAGEEAPPASGAAARVAEAVHALTGDDYRVSVLGPLQRGGDPNSHDRVLAARFGAAAVRAIHERRFGHLVGVHAGATGLTPLSEVVGVVRRIDPESELVWTARSLGMSFGD